MPETATAHTRSVLLVHEDEQVRALLRRILSVFRFQIMDAIDGNSAMGVAAGHSGDIDLVISDLQMPEMDGIQLATKLQDRYPAMQVVLMSAFPAGLLILNNGWQFMPSPFLPTQLREKVGLMLGIAAEAGLLGI